MRFAFAFLPFRMFTLAVLIILWHFRSSAKVDHAISDLQSFLLRDCCRRRPVNGNGAARSIAGRR